jgi:hypothetical protein
VLLSFELDNSSVVLEKARIISNWLSPGSSAVAGPTKGAFGVGLSGGGGQRMNRPCDRAKEVLGKD